MEKFANLANSPLNGTINNIVTSLIVTSATSFPTSGNFRIRVDDEIMLVTAVSTNTFTITRAQEGTAAASHTNGVTVYHIFTAGGMDGFRSDFTSKGSLPAAGVAGRVHVSTALFREDGSGWSTFNPGIINPVTKPSLTGFSWFNQNIATSVDGEWGIAVACAQVAGAAEHVRGYIKSAPATPYTITAQMELDIGSNQTPIHAGCGLVFYENSSGKMILNMILSSAQKYYFDCRRMTDADNFSADTGALSAYPVKRPWFRITDNGTNRIYEVSYDGVSWITLLTEGRTTFITADKIGFALWHKSTRVAFNLLSYLQT